MDTWRQIEGKIWDALESLEEFGEPGIYRGQAHDWHEVSKAQLGEVTGLDFRQGWNRNPLDQLVALGLVNVRKTGDRRVSFYSLPEGMTHAEYFQRKGQARYEHKQSQQESVAKRPERHTQPLMQATPTSGSETDLNIHVELSGLPDGERVWTLSEVFQALDALDDDVARHNRVKRWFGVTGDWSLPAEVEQRMPAEVKRAREQAREVMARYTQHRQARVNEQLGIA